MRLILFWLLFVFLSTGCSDPDRPNVELIQDMMVSPAVKAQDFDHDRPGKMAMRLPPKGTVPRGFTPYAYHFDPSGAEANLKNPVEGKLTPPILAVGRNRVCRQCSQANPPLRSTTASKFRKHSRS